ncbi:hypothetical protein DFH09DRAFT_1440915 [Mycena vulgaris]|nr:hypothetical protein DFH09DRAFT_1440915 [Mycena vulgaris]
MSSHRRPGFPLLCARRIGNQPVSPSEFGQRCSVFLHVAGVASGPTWVGDRAGGGGYLREVAHLEGDRDWSALPLNPPGQLSCGCVRTAIVCANCGLLLGTLEASHCAVHEGAADEARAYTFLGSAVYALPPPRSRKQLSQTDTEPDSAAMRLTHPASQHAGAQEPQAEASPDADASASGVRPSVHAPPAFEDVVEPEPYFEDDEEVRTTFIAILETYLGQLDPDAEIVLPAVKVFSLPSGAPPSQPDATELEEARAERRWEVAANIWRDRAEYEARVSHPSVDEGNPHVAAVAVTPAGKTVITVNEMGLQAAERARRMMFYQAGFREAQQRG